MIGQQPGQLGAGATNRGSAAPIHGGGSEKAVAAQCDDFAEQAGWTVERYEQTRATRITLGLPDRRYVHLASGWRVWVELKKPGGKLTLDQHAWLMAEQKAGGLALVVDDVAVLAEVHRRWKGLYGQRAALDYCAAVTKLTAQRGYRRTG